jgi:hypothetical protein
MSTAERFLVVKLTLYLQVHVPGRMVADSTFAALQNVLNRAHGLTTGQKFVGAVGTIVSTVLTVSPGICHMQPQKWQDCLRPVHNHFALATTTQAAAAQDLSRLLMS